MSSLTLNGDTSGSILIQAPAIAGSGTLTLPTGTATLAIQGPTFSAYQSSVQTLSAYTITKIQLQTEEWDTANCFNTSTFRFTPNVAGYYQVNGQVQVGASYTNMNVFIFKNGATAKAGYYGLYAASNVVAGAQVTALVYLNGSTDYIELYAEIQNGQILNVDSANTYFQAFLARAA